MFGSLLSNPIDCWVYLQCNIHAVQDCVWGKVASDSNTLSILFYSASMYSHLKPYSNPLLVYLSRKGMRQGAVLFKIGMKRIVVETKFNPRNAVALLLRRLLQ